VELTDHFDVLLRDTINLGRTALDLLPDRADKLYTALASADSFTGTLMSWSPQGSWAHETIIKPVAGKEFDADVMLVMRESPEWEPRDYINRIYDVLDDHPIYSTMPHECHNRCARVYYSTMHVDLVPFITLSNGRQVIVNRDDNDWEDSNPAGFTQWMHERDNIADRNLRKVIRIMKFLRDHRNSFTGTRSVLLTVMLGNQVDGLDKLDDLGCYASVPKTLLTIVTKLDNWLQDNKTKPPLPVPGTPGVVFDENRWKQESYAYFRDRIHTHAAQIHDAFYETDAATSVSMWQDLFGPGFKAPEPPVSSGRFGGAAATIPPTGRSGRAG
jgi:Second Messenger Oligonucleotide or Dinucleotide Synthetase domain